jgi:chemotaxis protein methyltransferase CheR
MEPNIPDEQLSRFSDFVADALGLHFPPPRWPDLRRGLAAAANALGFENPGACAARMMSAPLTKGQLDELASNLTVGETYFLRESRSFEVLAEHVLPTLIRARQDGERRLRIWSAACCTGEEAYSIAILLRRTIPNLENWNVTLLATDINPLFLRKAASGLFGQWSFRETPAWIKQRYFKTAPNGQLEILPEIKRMVRFAQLNLAEDAYPSLANDTNAMDVIFCRNVLMYFTAAQASRVLRNFYRAQAEGGWLFVSPSELSTVSSSAYTTASLPGVTLYRKIAGKPNPQGNPVAVDVESPIAGPTSPLTMAGAPLKVAPPLQSNSDSYSQACALHEEGRYAQAVAILEQLSSFSPPGPSELRLLARCLANQGELTKALVCCDQWIASEKLNAAAHYLRAVILQEQGVLEHAGASLRNAIYLDPNFPLPYFCLGNISRFRGQFHEANKHLETAVRLLRRYQPSDIIPESDGVTAGRLIEMIGSMTKLGAA